MNRLRFREDVELKYIWFVFIKEYIIFDVRLDVKSCIFGFVKY